ncbi:MAG: prepilin-type N-terminal cleavage/methylation domain-containing protein [Cloacibacillus sp.]
MGAGRKGFTLVELLIVIIIIGILAGMMMLATTGVIAKAEATRIVSNLRTLKSAVIMYQLENGKLPMDTRIFMGSPNSLDKYLDGAKLGNAYYVGKLSNDLWVAYAGHIDEPKNGTDSDVWRQLVKMAEKTGIDIQVPPEARYYLESSR